MMKKIGALVLALVMVLAMGTTAFADTAEIPGNYGSGSAEEGVNGQFSTGVGLDNPTPTEKNVNIKKEIKAFNPKSTTVHAPVVTYTYTVTAPDVTGLTVTDQEQDHTAGGPVVVPVKAGIITGLVVTGVNAAGTAMAGTNNGTSAVASLVFDNTSTWTTAPDGVVHPYDINLSFAGVTFPQPGVYRYQIAETISTTLANIAMEAGTGVRTLYLDVYVDGSNNIYGYVCMTANDSVTPSTSKVNGFVNGTSNDASDKYYTYDLVLSKDVVNDTYAANNTAFPFTVFFNNSQNYTSTFVIGQTVGDGSTGLGTSNPAILTLETSAVSLSGVALVKDGNTTTGTTVGDITLTGIPAGMDVDVYETNIATGVTYTVETSVTGGTAVKDNAVISDSTPASAVAQGTTKANYQSTKATVDTNTLTATAAQSVVITNKLMTISPTGVVLRVAPYVLILAAGITLLLISRRRKAAEEE